MAISASWSPSSCASVASRPTSSWSRCAAIPALPWRFPPCLPPNAIAMHWCWRWPPTTSFSSLRISTKRCRCAATAAAEGRIITFGIERTYPATNYGYIRPGEKLNGVSVRAIEAFVEKPDAEIAATYVAERYLWNSGNFLFHAATMLGEIERFEPGIAEAAKAAVAGLTRDLDFLRLAGDAFASAPKKSIDYAVMERTKLAAVVPADIGWS